MPKPSRFLRPSSKRKSISRTTTLLPMPRPIWQFSLNRCRIPRDCIPVEAICLLLSLRPLTFQCREVDFPRVRQNGFTPNSTQPITPQKNHVSADRDEDENEIEWEGSASRGRFRP